MILPRLGASCVILIDVLLLCLVIVPMIEIFSTKTSEINAGDSFPVSGSL